MNKNLASEELWHWYNGLKGLSFFEKEELLARFCGIEELYYAKEQDLLALDFCKKAAADKAVLAVLDQKQREKSRRSFQELKKEGMHIAGRGTAEYPKKLKQIPAPPFAIYFYGSLPQEEAPAVAVVGARQCSVYGEEIAAHFARQLSKAGIQIISGMARGIDSSAQRAAISEEGRAYAVLGSGADVCYPKEQKLLYEELKERGGVLSEELPGTQPFSWNFPKRNRIISALADGVLLVEARENSGSLITAEHALEQGKEVYAIPGRIYDSLSAGTNRLIQEGAKMVCGPEDILLSFSSQKTMVSGKREKKENIFLETKEKIVYASLSLQPKHIGQIAEDTGIPLSELAYLLLELEIRHYIKQTAKNYYISVLQEQH